MISKDKKRLLSNFFSLSVLQGLNMILPLITLPYLIRVLGIEKFGLVNFSLSIIMYFNILVSFGFDLSATREISVYRDNTKKISEIFFSVMAIKFFLVIVSFICLSILIIFVDTFSKYAMLYFATFGIVIGNLVFPSWFFQGMERMKYITYINAISKISFTILIFVLVHGSSDFIYVPILNSLGVIFGGIYSLWLIFKLFDIVLVLPTTQMISKQFVDSFHFFLSRVANNGSRYFAITVIGLYFGNKIVGYYSMIEKLFNAFMSLGGVISQTIYPYMSRTKNIIFFKKIFYVIIILSIIVIIPLMYFNKTILLIIFNIQDEMLSKLFVIIFSGSIFGIMSALVGYPLLAAFGYIKHANNSLIYASFIYTIYIIISAAAFHNIYYVAYSLVVYEVCAFLFRMYYINKAKLFSKVGNEK